MTDSQPDEGTSASETAESEPKKGRFKRMLLPIAMRYSPIRRGLGIHTIYRDTGGGLIVGGLTYAALFALIPTMALIIAGIYILVDDPSLRAEAVELVNNAFPALEDVTRPAIDGAAQFTAVGSIVALAGFAWGASGLYLNLTRAMERFFPGERVSGVLARVLGVLLVVLVIVGVLAAVFVAGILTVVASALAIDSEWLLTVVSAVVTLALATGLAYGIYRVIPSSPPAPHSARLPAVLVGSAIGLMTLFYGLISPWLVSGYQMFGVMASVFVALIWLRVVFMAIIYGAAMARYRDHVSLAASMGIAEPDAAATADVLSVETERIRQASAPGPGSARAASATAATDADEVTDDLRAADPPGSLEGR